MTPAIANLIGASLLMLGGLAGMAALSHCPRWLRAWPAVMVGISGLVVSDRSMMLLDANAPLQGIRAWLTILALGSSAATIAAMAYLVMSMCPLCIASAARQSPRQIISRAQGNEGA